jgi:hypothetical protein
MKLRGTEEQKIVQGVEFAEKTARGLYAQLRRLNPPTSLARAHAKMLANTLTLLAGFPPEVKAAKVSVAAFERVSAEEQSQDSKLGDQVAALWRQLGVPACNK